MRPDEIAGALGKTYEALAKAPPESLPSSLVAKCCACGQVGPVVGIWEYTGGHGDVKRLYCATWTSGVTFQDTELPAMWVYDRADCEERQGEGVGR